MWSAEIPVLAIVVILAAGAWVYTDAKRRDEAGAGVSLRVGEFAIDTPAAWLIGCIVASIIVLPLYYLSSRSD